MNRKRNPKARGSQTLRQKTDDIPQIPCNYMQTHRYRFRATSDFDAFINSTSLLGVPGLASATTTDLYPIARALRIRKIEVWAPTGTSTTPSILELTWTGSVNGPAKSVSDVSVNVSKPAHIVTRPPKDSLCSFWVNQSATPYSLFSLACPSGSVVDIVLQWTQKDDSTPGTVVVVTGATAGLVYYGYLDGDSTHLLSPVSRAAIF